MTKKINLYIITSFIIKLGTRFLIYCIGLFLNYFAFNILNSYQALKFMEIDLIHKLSSQQFIIGLGVCIALLGIWSYKKRTISGLNIAIKKYQSGLYTILFVLGIIVWFKCGNESRLLMLFWIEMFLLYNVIEYENTKTFNYIMNNGEEVSYLSEGPVRGRDNLTKAQVKGLEQLKKVLERSSSSDNYNIALIADWGKGKSSVVDTLVSEFQKEGTYFCLKISTQLFNGTYNIVEYVYRYFYSLFKKYGIIVFEGKNNFAFLSAVTNMLKDTISIADIGEMLNFKSEFYFSDVESERELFSKRIKKLLKKSGRKNILIFVDDADRQDTEVQILQLLGELTSIKGIISVVSLNESYDLQLRPQWEEGDEQNSIEMEDKEIYNPLDKYIHMRIRIEDMNHIEYEKSIKKLIVDENKMISKQQNAYLICDKKMLTTSVFFKAQSFQMQVKLSGNKIDSAKNNILFELFIYNLENNPGGLGDYLEHIVLEYFYHSKELSPHILKMLNQEHTKWGHELWLLNATWTNIFHDEVFDWIMMLRNNASQFFLYMGEMTDALDLIKVNREARGEIICLEDLYEYINMIKFPDSNRTWKNRKDNPVVHSGLKEFILIAFEDDEKESVKRLLEIQDYEKLKVILLEKIKQIWNFYYGIEMFMDFIAYVRKIMNNYRTFKMQLREAQMLDLNYLDYLVKEWRRTSEYSKYLEEIKNQYLFLKEIQLNYPSLESYLSTILYSTYITAYGTRFFDEQVKEYKAWLFYHEKNIRLIISSKNNGIVKNEVLDVSGKRIEVVTDAERKIIEERAQKLMEDS